MLDDRGKLLGYKNLDELRRNLEPILLRRTRASVLDELPPRMTEIVRVEPTAEQQAVHNAHMQVVAAITRKKYISEMDLLRLRKALLMCRMSADSTFLVDKTPPAYSSKLERLDELLGQLLVEPDRKIVLFSEWTTMLGLIEPMLRDHRAGYVRLDGSVPQKKRPELVHRFHSDPGCRLFITTNAGATGLNLQAANTVINVDLPWNPAILEQRIARAHRMGQTRPVQVFVLVSEGTIEENLLATLSAKYELSNAALDADSDIDAVDLCTGIDELKARLEVLLGAKPMAPVDQSVQRDRQDELERLSHRNRVAAAGGQLVTAAFRFLDEMIPADGDAAATTEMERVLRRQLAQCVDRDEATGHATLKVTLPDAAALDSLARSLSRLLVQSQQ